MFVDIRNQFGQRVRELRARSGMSQEILAYRAELDRTYLSGVERGERNVSLVNIVKIAAALSVSVEYMFSSERFSSTPAYQPNDFSIPFTERFKYQLDADRRVLAFQVHGLLTGDNVDFMSKTLMGICSSFGKGELSVFVDHRDMKASDGEPVVYSPIVADRAIAFQRNLLLYSSKAVVLCNSEFQVHQLKRITQESGIPTVPLFGRDKDMVGQAYELLNINGNDLIKVH